MENRTILFLTGPSCSGKSTILKNLIEKVPNNYLVSYDHLKWQLGGFDRNKHRPVMSRLSFGYLDVVCSEDFFVLLELWPLEEQEYVLLNEIATKHGYVVKVVHVTASKNILMERWQKRIADAKSAGDKISITDVSIYENEAAKERYLPSDAYTIDTTKISTDEATQQVLEILGA